jgi:hypothetical protein
MQRIVNEIPEHAATVFAVALCFFLVLVLWTMTGL